MRRLLDTLYDAGMRDERDGASNYEPVVSRLEVSMEGRLRKLEEQEGKREGEMKEMLKMMRELHGGHQNLQRGQSSGFRSNPQNRNSRSGGEVTCYRCLKKGHFARDCPNDVTCNKCYEAGHMQSQCPKN